MIVTDLDELVLHPVVDRGQPNAERIPILVRESTDMGCYGLMIGVMDESGFAMPVQDNLFWFGDGVVNAGDWVLLYTGSGTSRTSDWTNPPGSKIYSLHWGRRKTIFANSLVVPILFRTDSARIGQSPENLPQVGATGA